MKKTPIDNIEFVEDAAILGHLRAAKVNIEYAVKDFKRAHFELKDTELATSLNFLRSWADQQLRDFVGYFNAKVQGEREEKMLREMKCLRKRSTLKGGRREQ
jgi:hypothetical protein